METSLDASQYPRTYRLSVVWMAFMLLFGMAAAGVGAYAAWYLVHIDRASNGHQALVPAGVFALIAIFGLYLLQAVPKYRVVLYADRIELYEFLKARSLPRTEILGRRIAQQQNSAPTTVLVSRDGKRDIQLAPIYQMDDAFQEWIETLPDLDAQELQASEEEILGSKDSPARAERAEALARAKVFAWIMTAVTVAAGLWSWFFPQLYGFLVLAFLPWLAVLITACSKGLFRTIGDKNDAHPALTVPFVLPGIALAALSFGFHLRAWTPALAFSAGVGIALWIAVAAADSSLRQSRGNLFVVLLLTAVYGYGASVQANILLDRSPETVYRPPVVGKYTTSARSTTYYLSLGPWGPDMETGEVSVSRSFYQSLKPGDRVCVAVKPGALHIPWDVVRQCD
jgi:hypothetical protein